MTQPAHHAVLDRDGLATITGGQNLVNPRTGGDPTPPVGNLPPLPKPTESGSADGSRCLNPRRTPWAPLPVVGGPGTVPFIPCPKLDPR